MIQLILLIEIEVERVKGIEPSSQAWEARILPLNHTRLRCASARQARLAGRIIDTANRIESHCFYQTAWRLATGLQGDHATASSRLMASHKRCSIKICRSGEV